MKTLELNLKKDVLIVDENDFDYYEIFKEGVYFKLENGDREFIKGQFFIYCKGSELTEEIASELVNSDDEYGVVMYQNYRTTSMCYFDEQINALESFISAVESKDFHWLENPVKIHTWASENADEYRKKWQEAEEKTFRNPLIFEKK